LSRRVLLATFGSLGDLHPFIAVGSALRDRGIDVRLATSADYRALVEGAGLEFAPMRPSLEQFGDKEALARRLLHPLRGAEILMRELVLPFVREAHADLTRAADGADLCVSHTLTFTLPMIATLQRKPWLSAALSPGMFLSRHDPPVVPGIDLLRMAQRLGPWAYDLALGLMRGAIRRWERPLHDFRREIGVPPIDQLHLYEGQFSPYGTLALFDGLLSAPQPDWPANVTVCGAPMHDGPPADPLALGELQRFLDRGERPVVFALGSSAVHIARDFWREAIDASRRLGRRAILLTGKPIDLPAGDDLLRFDYLPYSAVFPHAAAIVHQVGIGTLSQALRSGRPQLLVPVAFDQPDNAHRAAKLGVARVLPWRQATASRLAAELKLLLDDPAVTSAAQDVGRRLRDVNGAPVAAARILATLDGAGT
jgi:UDP:flavonoid glycosyltransferase YjiC (YdhE family)